MKGLEGEFTLHLPQRWELNANATYLDTSIDGFVTQDPNLPAAGVDAFGLITYPTRDLTGNRFAYAPKYTLNFGVVKSIDYGHLGDGQFRADMQFVSDTYLDIFNNRNSAFRPAYVQLNASYLHHLPDVRWSVLFWARNLTNETVVNNVVDFQIPSTPQFSTTQQASLNDPRTFGVTIKREF